MLVIGLTGGIGAGKSVVANLFADYGVPIIDADVIAREVTHANHPSLNAIRHYFGDDVFLDDQTLDRKKLREVIFSDPIKKDWLEKLLHPIIQEEIRQQINKQQAPYCIVVIPLLIEVKPYDFISRILVVDATEHEQIKRVKERDKIGESQIQSILNAQTSRQARLSQAHDIIINDGNLSDLKPQVEILHQRYLQMSKNN